MTNPLINATPCILLANTYNVLLTASKNKWGGGVLTPKKNQKKNQKNKQKTKPIYQLVFLGFFLVFFVFLGFFGIFWDDIPTLNLNTKKTQKIPKKNQKKNQKKPTEPKKPVSNFECWPRPMPKKQKKPKKTKKKKKTSFQFRILAKTNAKKPKKNQCQFGNLKKPKKTKKKP